MESVQDKNPGARNKAGRQSVKFENPVFVRGCGSVVGQTEKEGPLGECFDGYASDPMFGEKTWEKAESKMLKGAMIHAMKKAGRKKEDLDMILSGDLINQLMSSSFMARDMNVPFLGVYGACSTMTESLLVGSMLLDGGYGNNIICCASSHFCTAERQFRMPVEHGNQKPPSAQYTATAAGAMVISDEKLNLECVCVNADSLANVRITGGTIGKVLDAGIADVNQMGSAMAPAAVDTIITHFDDLGRNPEYYDLILTGDLGHIGRNIAIDLLAGAGYDKNMLMDKYHDCGVLMYDSDRQDVHSGGSGCGCSAAVYCGKIIPDIMKGRYKRVLLVSTGAMLSSISPMQGESIPGIAHAVALERI